jgi:nitrite reductase/ring-hydroxylating ferredoxin subunit
MWVPIALGRDVPRATTRAVIIGGEELVAWRAEGGAVAIWEDRCPHRGMRLSFGFVRGDSLNCLYHGWAYGSDGACRRIPAHPDLAVPPTIRANARPAAETGGLILVGTGDDPGQPPVLPAGRPIASLAIGTTPDILAGLLNGSPLEGVQGASATLDGIDVTLGWHVVSPEKLMLHAVAIDPGDVETRTLRALHRLRAAAEERLAA